MLCAFAIGCAHVTRPYGNAIPSPGFVTWASFDTARSVAITPRDVGQDTTRAALRDVLAIGGIVLDVIGDTLLLQPFWIVRAIRSPVIALLALPPVAVVKSRSPMSPL